MLRFVGYSLELQAVLHAWDLSETSIMILHSVCEMYPLAYLL